MVLIVPDKDTKSRPPRSQSVHTSFEAGQCPPSKGTQESGWNMTRSQNQTVRRVSATTRHDGLRQAHVTWLKLTVTLMLHVDGLLPDSQGLASLSISRSILASFSICFINPLRGNTTNWRAGCGKSASPVRREGRPKPIGLPYPYLAPSHRGVGVARWTKKSEIFEI
jgi:hypothetical protein